MKVVAIIQARMGSSRLPGKVLMDIAGKPALAHVILRVKAAGQVKQTIIATTSKLIDQAIVDLALTYKVDYHTGSEHDVLDRYYRAARKFKADAVVRITADCPLIDPAVIDLAVARFLERNGAVDYVSTDDTFPDGLDTSVFSVAALERAWREAELMSEREHVTPYISNHPDKFSIETISHRTDLGRLRWTLDTLEDLVLIREIFERANSQRSRVFSLDEVVHILETYPELTQINSHIVRNEGYIRSLQNDFVIGAPHSKVA